jgi:hypothetical protein
MPNKSWIIVAGQEDQGLAEEIASSIKARIQSGMFDSRNVAHIASLDFSLVSGTLEANEKEMAVIRRLCQSWDVDLRPFKISSHRPFIGPLIVFVKQIAFRVLRVFFKEFVTQQRDFNAATVALLGTLLSERSKKS